jgi:hypothetical protein
MKWTARLTFKHVAIIICKILQYHAPGRGYLPDVADARQNERFYLHVAG